MWAYPFDLATVSHLSALTTGHFWSWPKVTKSRAPLHPARRFAPGPLAAVSCGASRPPAGYASLHLATSATAEGRYAPAPPDTSARPADGAQVTGGVWAGVVPFSGFCGVCSAHSRVNPLPQVLRCSQQHRCVCGNCARAGICTAEKCQGIATEGDSSLSGTRESPTGSPLPMRAALYLWERVYPRKDRHKQQINQLVCRCCCF